MFWDNQPIATTLAGAPATNPVYWTDILQLANAGNTTGDQKQLIMLSKKSGIKENAFQSYMIKHIHSLQTKML